MLAMLAQTALPAPPHTQTPPSYLRARGWRYYFPGAPAIEYYRNAFARACGLVRPPERHVTAFAYLLSSVVLRPTLSLGAFNPYPLLLGRYAPRKLWLRTADGLRIAAWHFLPRSADPRAPGVVVVHGRAVNKESVLHYVRFLRRRYQVLAIDLRCHGESEGRTTTFGAKEVQELRAAVDWLFAGGAPRVALMGVSLGAGTCVLAAGEDPRVAAVVADAPFARLRALLEYNRERLRIPREPFSPLAKFILDRRCDWDIDAVNPVEAAARARAPMLVIHGSEDPLIPLEHGRAVQRAAPPGSELFVAPGGHGTVYFRHRRAFSRRVLRFLDRQLGR